MARIVDVRSFAYDGNSLNDRIEEKVKLSDSTVGYDSYEQPFDKNDIYKSIKNDIALLKNIYKVEDVTFNTRFKKLSPIIIPIKKLFHRLLKWVFFGYVEQQNQINLRIINTIEKIDDLLMYIDERNEEYYNED